MNEKVDVKESLLPINEVEGEDSVASPIASGHKRVIRLVVGIIVFCVGYGLTQLVGVDHHRTTNISRIDECPGLEKIVPNDGFADADQFFTPEYKNYSLRAWSEAVKIPSVSYDDLGDVGEDDRWLVFGDLHKYLQSTFPLVFEKFDVEYINTYGLLFTLNGKNHDLKPVILMAHQDVVPVPPETIPRWSHPPFEGYFDGEFLWGRGSGDCKNNLIGILEAVESLLKQDYSPERTIILSFGFDEETSGSNGAARLAEYLENKLGPDSVFMIVDEGGDAIQKWFGSWFGLPGTGEKGYLDIRITLTTAGGHSSIPPDHTAIGIISQLITAIESSPYISDITKGNPFYYHLQCLAKEGKSIDKGLKSDIEHLDHCPAAKKRVIGELEKTPALKYIIRTSQAVDIINGGIKINALPEQVVVDVNHRVAIESSLEFVKQKVIATVSAVATKFDFGVVAFGNQISGSDESKGFFDISSLHELNPAPVSPIHNNPSWDLLGGTIRQVFEDVNGGSVDGPITVAPSIMTGNTDTRFYWNLTKNIYRVSPIVEELSFNIHAIDEHTSLDGHIQGVSFYYNFLRNLNVYNDN